MAEFRTQFLKIKFLKLSPNLRKNAKSFLEKMGMDKEIRDHVFTSGQASLNYLKQNLSTKKFFHVGPPRDFDLFNDFVKSKSDNIDDGDYILCTGLFEKFDKDLNYYNGIFFDVVSSSFGKVIGSGGRYDSVLHAFNLDSNAFGFALRLHYLEQALKGHVS